MAAHRKSPQGHHLKLASIRHRIIAWLFIILTGVYVYACTYFNVREASVLSLQQKIERSHLERTFFVHTNHYLEEHAATLELVHSMEDVEVTEDGISGVMKQVHQPYYYTEGRSKRYRGHERTIVHEVHIYVDSTFTPEKGPTHLPVEAIEEIKILGMDSGRVIFSFIGGVIGFLIVIGIIVMMTKSSCPYIYVHDGEDFVFEGETFGGAIAQNLERDDYMPLPSIRPDNGLYKIRISNELKERQYTDLANLLVAQHAPGTTILVDQQGEFHGFRGLSGPARAMANAVEDIGRHLAFTDTYTYAFDDALFPINEVVLEFDKPIDSDRGLLVLEAKNTLWFDYQFGQALENLGESFDDWMAQQATLTTEERMSRGAERHIPLAVYLKNGDEWQLVDRLLTVGPLASRKMVVPMDLTGLPDNRVEVKLETGFMFWEIDFAAMGFDKDQDFQVQRLVPGEDLGTPMTATDRQLARTDKVYLEQLYTGDVAELTFAAPEVAAGKASSVFLHTRGYYELVRDFTGPPRMSELLRYRDPMWMAQVSQLQYLATINYEEQVAYAGEQ